LPQRWGGFFLGFEVGDRNGEHVTLLEDVPTAAERAVFIALVRDTSAHIWSAFQAAGAVAGDVFAAERAAEVLQRLGWLCRHVGWAVIARANHGAELCTYPDEPLEDALADVRELLTLTGLCQVELEAT
jgi:hypothetical protein